MHPWNRWVHESLQEKCRVNVIRFCAHFTLRRKWKKFKTQPSTITTLLNLYATLTCNMSAISLFKSSSKSSSRGNVQTLSPHFSPARIISDESSFLFVKAPIYRFDRLLMQVPVIEKKQQGCVKMSSVLRTAHHRHSFN